MSRLVVFGSASRAGRELVQELTATGARVRHETTCRAVEEAAKESRADAVILDSVMVRLNRNVVQELRALEPRPSILVILTADGVGTDIRDAADAADYVIEAPARLLDIQRALQVVRNLE